MTNENVDVDHDSFSAVERDLEAVTCDVSTELRLLASATHVLQAV